MAAHAVCPPEWAARLHKLYDHFPLASEDTHVLCIIATVQGDAEVVAECLLEPRSREHPASRAPVLSWSVRYERLAVAWT